MDEELLLGSDGGSQAMASAAVTSATDVQMTEAEEAALLREDAEMEEENDNKDVSLSSMEDDTEAKMEVAPPEVREETMEWTGEASQTSRAEPDTSIEIVSGESEDDGVTTQDSTTLEASSGAEDERIEEDTPSQLVKIRDSTEIEEDDDEKSDKDDDDPNEEDEAQLPHALRDEIRDDLRVSPPSQKVVTIVDSDEEGDKDQVQDKAPLETASVEGDEDVSQNAGSLKETESSQTGPTESVKASESDAVVEIASVNDDEESTVERARSVTPSAAVNGTVSIEEEEELLLAGDGSSAAAISDLQEIDEEALLRDDDDKKLEPTPNEASGDVCAAIERMIQAVNEGKDDDEEVTHDALPGPSSPHLEADKKEDNGDEDDIMIVEPSVVVEDGNVDKQGSVTRSKIPDGELFKLNAVREEEEKGNGGREKHPSWMDERDRDGEPLLGQPPTTRPQAILAGPYSRSDRIDIMNMRFRMLEAERNIKSKREFEKLRARLDQVQKELDKTKEQQRQRDELIKELYAKIKLDDEKLKTAEAAAKKKKVVNGNTRMLPMASMNSSSRLIGVAARTSGAAAANMPGHIPAILNGAARHPNNRKSLQQICTGLPPAATVTSPPAPQHAVKRSSSGAVINNNNNSIAARRLSLKGGDAQPVTAATTRVSPLKQPIGVAATNSSPPVVAPNGLRQVPRVVPAQPANPTLDPRNGAYNKTTHYRDRKGNIVQRESSANSGTANAASANAPSAPVVQDQVAAPALLRQPPPPSRSESVISANIPDTCESKTIRQVIELYTPTEHFPFPSAHLPIKCDVVSAEFAELAPTLSINTRYQDFKFGKKLSGTIAYVVEAGYLEETVRCFCFYYIAGCSSQGWQRTNTAWGPPAAAGGDPARTKFVFELSKDQSFKTDDQIYLCGVIGSKSWVRRSSIHRFILGQSNNGQNTPAALLQHPAPSNGTPAV